MVVKFEKSGIVLINKPAGISSNKVVNIVKHKLGAKKCGHLGTLDLEGEGLLPITVNNATKLFDYFLNKDKTYETVFVFGFETDTLDLSGTVIKTKECEISEQEVLSAMKGMIGSYDQMPPQYSAKKVGGKCAYKEARAGNEVKLSPKKVVIYDFKLLEKLEKNTYKFSLSCSSGTYVRSVCRDLAEKLSTYGSMQCILRTRCGNFNLRDAYSLKDVEDGNFKILPCDILFDNEIIALSETEKDKILNGQFLKNNKPDGKYKVFCKDEFLGIGEVFDKLLKLKIRLF